MNSQMLEVMQRRGELLARIAMQREQIAATGKRWEVPLATADKGLAVVRFLRANPVLTAAVAAVFVMRRRGAATVFSSGWRLWRLYRRAMSYSAKAASLLHPQ